MVPFALGTILEIGCGPGMATMTPTEAMRARITATDTAEVALLTPVDGSYGALLRSPAVQSRAAGKTVHAPPG